MADNTTVTILDENDKTYLEQKIDTHTTSTENPHNVTAAQTGAVNKNGDTMNGELKIEIASYPKVRFKTSGEDSVGYTEGNAAGMGMITVDDESDNSAMRGIYVRHSTEFPNLSDGAVFMSRIDGVSKNYKLYGQHNITCGTTDLVAGSSTLLNGDIYLVYS